MTEETMDLKQHFEQTTSEIKELVSRQESEIKQLGETTEKTAGQLRAAEKRLDEIAATLPEEGEKRIQELEKRAQSLPDGGGDNDMVRLSPGDAFVMSDEFKRAARAGSRNTGAVSVKRIDGAVEMSRQEFKELVTDDDGSAGALVQPERDMTVHRQDGRRMQHVRDLLPSDATSSDTIEFIQNSNYADSAGSQDGQFSEKNQSGMSFDLKQSPVVTIGHWIPVSRQAMSDAQQLRAYIDTELMHGLRVEEDQQLLYGDGTASTLTGLLNHGIQDLGARAADDNRLDHVRKAFRDLRTSNFSATGILVNPADWADIELIKGDDGQYLWASVQSVANGAQPTVWRVPVVESNAVEEGEFLAGDWDVGARVWDREQATIRMSESHADFFIKNGLALLAEERLALAVTRPKAFVRGDFSTA